MEKDGQTKNRATPHALGQAGEEFAIRHLKKKGYKIIETGFRFLRGEIDIIASEKKTLVFIEVKTRAGKNFGFPEEAVTPAKQEQIRKIAECYLIKHKLQDVECRFDVLSIFYSEDRGYEISHFKDAF